RSEFVSLCPRAVECECEEFSTCLTLKLNSSAALSFVTYFSLRLPSLKAKVRSLDLSINNIVMIKTFDFKDLSALQSLNTSCNRMSHVDDGAFSDLVVLQELNLANNRLNTLSDHLFQGLGNLSVLRLDYNHIKIISSSTFQNLSSLNVLNLTGNQLNVLKKVQTILLFIHLQELYICGTAEPQLIINISHTVSFRGR
uniref:Uncharacterized protein n=1 Tax=Oncorhynchus tshawytscha TaxID=74940 RepID=A0AAZ3S5N0_ONCTS